MLFTIHHSEIIIFNENKDLTILREMMFDTYSPRSRRGSSFHIKVKKLGDLCLESVGKNLYAISRVGRYLPTPSKELLLERLVNHDCLTEKHLPHVTYNLFSDKLKHVNLYKSEQLTDKVLLKLSQSGCQLQWLTIHGCSKVTDIGIQHITENQQELECLELRKLQRLTKKGVTKIASTKLKKIDLRGCDHLENEGVTCIIRNNPNINHIILVRCNKVTEDVIPVIASKLNVTLEVFDVGDMRNITDTGIQNLAQNCTNLKKLNIGGCNLITDAGIAHVFAKCKQLKSLNLSYCGNSIANSQVLQDTPLSIIELSLCGVMIKNHQLLVESVTRLSNLRSLWLCGVPTLSDDTLQEILSVIGGQLYELDLSGVSLNVTDKGLKYVTKYCVNLRVLGISLLQNVTGTSLIPLFKDEDRISQITGLMLACKKLSFDVIQQVSLHCHSLERLDLGGITMVDDLILSNIANNCHQLNYVNLKGCKEITDDGVCDIAVKCPLGVVVLAGLRHITDKSIYTLANSCPYLEEIYMNGCYNVSRKAIKYLTDYCIPRVYWTHKIPNAEHGLLSEDLA